MTKADPRVEAQRRRVLVPQAPVLVAGFREVLWLSPEGEIEALSQAEAARRVQIDPPMLCHAVATARRLDLPAFAALDLLELFAFVRPARFCVPTPRGLAESAGIASAATPDRGLRHPRHGGARASGGAWARGRCRGSRHRRGNGSRRMAVGPGRAGGAAAGRAAGAPTGCRLAGVDAACRMGRGGAVAAARQRAGGRRTRRAPGSPGCSAARPSRGRSRPITPPRSAPPSARASARPAACGARRSRTGVGKTLGYIAPASVWAEKNRGAVWISTFTRNLQTPDRRRARPALSRSGAEAPPRRRAQGPRELSVPAELRGGCRGLP